jgi:hypothetical protein
MSAPLISSVSDNYNYGRFLAQCIDSALAQTYQRLEVIVVDDVSTDDSRAVIARYAGRVTPVLQQVNGGQGAAFNAGYRASHGEIVLFLDADDWLYPHAAERIAAAWVPGVSKAHYRLDLVDSVGTWIDVHPPLEVGLDGGDVVPLLLRTGRYMTNATSGNAYARTALELTMPVPSEHFRLSADGYLNTVVPFHGPVLTIDERLGAYRQHGNNAYIAAGSSALGSLAERLRKWLILDADKHRALEAKVAAAGLRLIGNKPWLRDPAHLETRLASLRLDRGRHPHPDDDRFLIALHGMKATRWLRLSLPRRLLMAGWFLAVGFLPIGIATHAISWRMVGGARPVRIDRALKFVRRVLR